MHYREYDDDEINLAEVEEIAHAPDQSIIREVSDDEINLAEVEEITHAPDQSIIREVSDDEINFYLDQQRLIEQIKLISQEQPVAKKSFNLQNFILEKKVPKPLIFASVLTCSIIAIISFSSLTFLDVIYKAYENSQSQSSNNTANNNAQSAQSFSNNGFKDATNSNSTFKEKIMNSAKIKELNSKNLQAMSEIHQKVSELMKSLAAQHAEYIKDTGSHLHEHVQQSLKSPMSVASIKQHKESHKKIINKTAEHSAKALRAITQSHAELREKINSHAADVAKMLNLNNLKNFSAH